MTKQDVIDRMAAYLCNNYSQQTPHDWSHVNEHRRDIWRDDAKELLSACSDVGDGVGLAIVNRNVQGRFLAEELQ